MPSTIMPDQLFLDLRPSSFGQADPQWKKAKPGPIRISWMDVSASGYQNHTKKHYSNMLNPPQRNGENGSDTLLQTISSPLKINGWKMILSFGFRSIFGGADLLLLFQSWWNQRCQRWLRRRRSTSSLMIQTVETLKFKKKNFKNPLKTGIHWFQCVLKTNRDPQNHLSMDVSGFWEQVGFH